MEPGRSNDGARTEKERARDGAGTGRGRDAGGWLLAPCEAAGRYPGPDLSSDRKDQAYANAASSATASVGPSVKGPRGGISDPWRETRREQADRAGRAPALGVLPLGPGAPLWTASVSGKPKDLGGGVLELDEPAVQVFEREPKEEKKPPVPPVV